jgi:hypothetical protein
MAKIRTRKLECVCCSSNSLDQLYKVASDICTATAKPVSGLAACLLPVVMDDNHVASPSTTRRGGRHVVASPSTTPRDARIRLIESTTYCNNRIGRKKGMNGAKRLMSIAPPFSVACKIN